MRSAQAYLVSYVFLGSETRVTLLRTPLYHGQTPLVGLLGLDARSGARVVPVSRTEREDRPRERRRRAKLQSTARGTHDAKPSIQKNNLFFCWHDGSLSSACHHQATPRAGPEPLTSSQSDNNGTAPPLHRQQVRRSHPSPTTWTKGTANWHQRMAADRLDLPQPPRHRRRGQSGAITGQ